MDIHFLDTSETIQIFLCLIKNIALALTPSILPLKNIYVSLCLLYTYFDKYIFKTQYPVIPFSEKPGYLGSLHLQLN